MKKKELTIEERAFVNSVFGRAEERANLSTGENGAILTESIVDRIIQKVYDICPVYSLSTRYSFKGKVKVPYFDETTQSFNVAYAAEFVELESSSGQMLTIELDGFLAGVLTKVSKSLYVNSQINAIDAIVNATAKSISKWLENEILNGTTGKIAGLTGVTQKVTAAAATSVTTDELIDLQETILDEYQQNAVWIMNRATRKAIRKLKDEQGRYILNPEYTSRWGYTLFGKDVYTTSNMSTMAAGKTAIYYGDMSGLVVKMPEQIEVDVLTNKYAEQHVLGIISWIEADAKVAEADKIAKLEMAAAI